MGITVAIAAPGNMGAGVAARLVQGGSRVVTSLEGRSAASAARAQAAGMIPVNDNELAQADFILSIVPPKEALPFAARLAPVLQSVRQKPVYIDCNAVSPDSIGVIAHAIQATGAHFLDGSIIGMPPKPGGAGPTFYVSGPSAQVTQPLAQAGLLIKLMDDAIGSASALKMSYGGITKGLVALGSAMALASQRFGVEDALLAELAASQPHLMPWLSRMVPGMFPKAYRWVAEMDEISDYLGDRPEADMFSGIARMYERLAVDWEGDRAEIDVLAGMFRPEQAK